MSLYMKRYTGLLFIVLMINCSGSSSEVSPEDDTVLTNVTLGISFPPVANDEQRVFTAPLLKELNVAHIRIGENWSLREPTQGNFNWGPLDKRINWATENDMEVLLTIQSNGPDWSCSTLRNTNSCVYQDNDDFKNYVELLLQRYPNRISKIQYGNEWQSDFWYIGSEEQFTVANNIVYDAIKEFSPDTKMVLGGFTTISLRFLAGCNGLIDSFFDDDGNVYDRAFFDANCGMADFDRILFVLQNAKYDEADIHLYDDAENWPIYYENIKTMIQKPIIITEFGGPNLNIEDSSESYQAERLAKYIQVIDSLKIKEAYFFKLVEGSNNKAHLKSGLISSPALNKKESFFTFKKFNDQ